MKAAHHIRVWAGLVLIGILSGCCDEHRYVDKRSVQENADALVPNVRLIQEETLKLMTQHKWLISRLDKCLERLEAERGLEPIPLKSVEDKYREMGYPLPITDPNIVKQYGPPPEPFYRPYEDPNVPAWPTDKEYDLETLLALLRLQSLSIKLYVYSTDDWIENLEQRLKRLEGQMANYRLGKKQKGLPKTSRHFKDTLAKKLK